jgi:hypothetical protein
MLEIVAIWGLVAIVAAVLGMIVAGIKRRDYSSWGFWCFVLPPLLLVLIVMPKNTGPRPRKRSLDEEDNYSPLEN